MKITVKELKSLVKEAWFSKDPEPEPEPKKQFMPRMGELVKVNSPNYGFAEGVVVKINGDILHIRRANNIVIRRRLEDASPADRIK
jgi:hypothetical protein